MLIDVLLRYSHAQALTGTLPVVSTEPIDHGPARNLGLGERLAVFVSVVQGLIGAATEGITIDVQTDDDAAFGSPETIATSGALTESEFATGDRVVIPIPPDDRMRRYTRLVYTMTGTTPTATVSAWLTRPAMIQNEELHGDAITIN